MRMVRGSKRILVVAVLLAGVTIGLGPAASAQTTGTCDDGRDWTADTLQNGSCQNVNLCSPDSIDLSITDELTWSWVFPPTCPANAVDAFGVVVEQRSPTEPGGDPEDGTVARIAEYGQAAPGRTGGRSIPITCGDVALTFTMIAGSEVVATGSGSAVTPPCPVVVDPPDPDPVLLPRYQGTEGQVAGFARLYWAVFGRVPDLGGFGYWMARANNGLALRSAAAIWTNLSEWRDSYDGTEDDDFLGLIYQNVLGRQPDQGGFDYWLARLLDGLSRDQLVVLFSDAPEFRQRTVTG